MSRILLVLLTLVVLAGCGRGDAGEDRSDAPDREPTEQVSEAAIEAARDYLVAARSSTAETAVERFRERRSLAAPELRVELDRLGPPTAAQVAALRASSTGSNVDIVEADPSVADDVVTVEFGVRERTWSERSINEVGAVYEVEVVEAAGGRWLVRAFTIKP